MRPKRLDGLFVGFLVALATAVMAAGGATPAPPPNPIAVSASATPTAAVAALSTGTELPPASTASPTPTPSQSSPPASPTHGLAHTATPAPPSPSASPTRNVSETSTPFPTPAPPPTSGAEVEQIIGYSVQGRPIVAHRVGNGPIKVVLVGDIHGGYEANTHALAQQLQEHFQAHQGEIPPEVTLWIIPTMNPDGLAAGQRWNANGVDLNRNANTDMDGCAGNDWSPDTFDYEGARPGAGGPYPFSEPEARAVRDFLDDAWIAVFYHSAIGKIFVDTCQRHPPTARLADALSEGTNYPVPEEGWSGYPITGDFGDYLAGEGVAAVTVELTDHDDPEFDRNLAGVHALLAAVDEIVPAEALDLGAQFAWLTMGQGGNTGVWHYAKDTFIHPLAIEILDDGTAGLPGTTAYLLDGGRVLALRLDQPAAPSVLLAPGDTVDAGSVQGVEEVRVQEPLDLAADGAALLVLDRAGDVYRYDPEAGNWTVERYDRPSGDTYDHYFVALASSGDHNYLLETTHEQVWRFSAGQMGTAWVKLPQSRDIDLSARDKDLYVLTRGMNTPTGNLFHYRDAREIPAFQPNASFMHPRQVVATDTAVFVLDRGGRRLLALDPVSGALLTLHQFTDRQAVSALWADPSSGSLILAGRDTLCFPGEPDRQATIEGGLVLEGPQPHDPALLAELPGLAMPIEGATVTRREFQMPGAPRHYRLGTHEGIDFYGHTVGVPVNRRTPVRAVADGVVVRALVDYQPLTAEQANAWSAQSRSLGYTPPDVLDGYRGMQVWIDHGEGLVSRYAHLGSIEPGIIEGATVARGQVIAMVGNSGTPASVRSRTEDVHLHLELWIHDPSLRISEAMTSGQGHFVGQFLRPIEAREWLEKILR